MRLLQTTDPTAHLPRRGYLTPYISVTPTFKTASVLDRFSQSVKPEMPGRMPRHEYHITVLYGINETDESRLKLVLKPAIEWIVVPKGMTIFNNIENQTAHLVMEVECPRLMEYNGYIRQALQVRSSFDEYKPHITFASYDTDGKHHSPALNGRRPRMDYAQAMDAYEACKDEMNAAIETVKPELFFTNMRFNKTK